MDLRSSASLEFLNLTVRDSNDGEVVSALWFALDGDRPVTLLTDRRIAQHLVEAPEVLVSFSDRRGDGDAPRMSAVARPAAGESARRIVALLNEKYGWRRRAFRFMFWFTRRMGSTWDRQDHAFELQLTASESSSSRVDAPVVAATRRSPVHEVEVAEVVVNASTVKGALDHLTEVAVPLGLRVAADGDLIQFSFHDPELGWWASTTCRGVSTEPSRSVRAAVTVPRLVFREAIELAQLHPSAETTITVHAGESVHVGATAVGATQSWPVIPAPPAPTPRDLADADVLLPPGPREPDEKVSLVAGDVQVTALGALLDRFVARDIDRVALHVDEDGAALVGTTREHDPDDRLVLVVPAHLEP